MNATLRSTRGVTAMMLLVGVALAGCAEMGISTPPAIQQQIEAARTSADHETLAAYYVKEASSARTKAMEHRKMGKGYLAYPSGRGGGSMQAHCNAAASSYEDIASRLDAMAAEHRQMGAQAKP